MPKKIDSPVQLLAGKRTEEPVMREHRTNRRACSVPGESTTADNSAKSSVDACSSGDSLTQRMSALAKADLVRFARAGVRRRLETAQLGFDEFLDEVPEHCGTVAIVRVLSWLPNIARRRAEQILATLEIPESRVIQELTASDRYRVYEVAERHVSDYLNYLHRRAA